MDVYINQRDLEKSLGVKNGHKAGSGSDGCPGQGYVIRRAWDMERKASGIFQKQ